MVEYVIAHCTITPVRQEPSESSEQLTQLLFGEVCEVLDRLPRWTKIRSTLDGQEGWVDFKMLSPAPISSQEVKGERLKAPQNAVGIFGDPAKINGEGVISVPMALATDMETGEELMLTLGTRLPNYAHGTFEVLGKQYLIDPNCVSGLEDALRATGRSQDELQDAPLALQARGEEICAIAQTLLNAPYLWGGKNAMGMDCSGFTQVVYATQGINLLRNAREQMTQGELVPSLAEAQPGDLAFFDHADRDPKATNISHVGMLLSPTEIIHCSGCVHIDTIDEQGIHLPDGELTHHLVQIKRYL